MNAQRRLRSVSRWLLGGVALGVAAYATRVGTTWRQFGRQKAKLDEAGDRELDRFMPVYDVVERHHIRIQAPATLAFAAAKDMAIDDSPIVRAIFKAREVFMRAAPSAGALPRSLLAQTQALGWLVLTETPDREVVVGAVTKPWEPNPVFRPVPAEAFLAFGEPGYVKIVWTLRADPVDERASVFRTETRALATDAAARAKFRRYWAFVSPGIWLIRWSTLRPLRREAERRARPAH
jgi:hypothetical protein